MAPLYAESRIVAVCTYITMYIYITVYHALGGDSDSSSSSNSQSSGAILATACAVTFIVTLIATVTITFIVISIFFNKKFADIAEGPDDKQTTDSAAAANTVIYDTVGPPNQTNDKRDYELPNPGYGANRKVAMDNNPAYKSCK